MFYKENSGRQVICFCQHVTYDGHDEESEDPLDQFIDCKHIEEN